MTDVISFDPKRVDIEITAGDGRRYALKFFQVVDGARVAEPMNGAGITLEMTVATMLDPSDLRPGERLFTVAGVVDPEAPNSVSFAIPGSQSDRAPGGYVFDVVRLDAAAPDFPETRILGLFTIKPGVSRVASPAV